MATETNPALDILPDPGHGRFWDVSYSEKYRGKPLHIRLRESFRPGTPVGETIGDDFAEANDKSLVDTANNIMSRTADRKKYIGIHGLES